MSPFHRLRHARRLHLAVALFATTALMAACEPGFVTTYAGTGNNTGTVPTATVGPVTSSVSLQQPTSVVAIPDGGAYVYDATACEVYRTNNDGTTSLYAGTPGACGDTGDGGPAINAQINATVSPSGVQLPYMMATDGTGNLYLPGNNGATIRKIEAGTGTISSVSVSSNNHIFISGLATDTDGSIAVQITSLIDGSGSLTYGGMIDRVAANGMLTTVYTYPESDAPAGLANSGPGQFVAIVHDLERINVRANTLTDTGISASFGGSFISVLTGSICLCR